jgi:hypothetical protein
MPEADLYLRVHLDLISEQGGYRSTIIPFFVFLLVAMFVEFSLFLYLRFGVEQWAERSFSRKSTTVSALQYFLQ